MESQCGKVLKNNKKRIGVKEKDRLSSWVGAEGENWKQPEEK